MATITVSKGYQPAGTQGFISGETVTPDKLNSAQTPTVAISNIVDADIGSGAAISLSKLATGALPTAITVASANLVSATQQSLVPAGAVMPFAMNSAPSGWLAANGDAVSRSTYAALFAAIGTTHGVGDGSTTFNLPDLRGYFVRGSGTNGDGTASGTFAAKQADELKSHTHSARWLLTTAGVGSSTGGWGSGTAYSNNFSQIEATGGSETRPKNIALLYCIKH